MSSSENQQLVDVLTSGLSAKPEIFEAYLFGSRARGDSRLHSDIDVAVYIDSESLDGGAFGYAAELTAEIAAWTHRNDIDVVLLNHASSLLYHRVLRDGVRLFARNPRATTTREGRALSRYCDYLPHLRKIEAAHQARIRRGGFGR